MIFGSFYGRELHRFKTKNLLLRVQNVMYGVMNVDVHKCVEYRRVLFKSREHGEPFHCHVVRKYRLRFMRLRAFSCGRVKTLCKR